MKKDNSKLKKVCSVSIPVGFIDSDGNMLSPNLFTKKTYPIRFVYKDGSTSTVIGKITNNPDYKPEK